MAEKRYCTAETTNVSGKCFDFISDTDIENGSVAAKGELSDRESNIYTAKIPEAGDEVFLAANPAWSYESGLPSSQDEESFINPADKPFRVYGLLADNHDRFGVSEYGITSETDIAVGDYITVDGSSFKLKNAGTLMPSPDSFGFIGRVADIRNGTVFTFVKGGSSENTGRKVIIEVIKNSTVSV